MNRKEAIRIYEQEARLLDLGFTRHEAEALRKISRQLHSWFERCCDEDIDDSVRPAVLTYYSHSGKKCRVAIPNREAGAMDRLDKIMLAHPELQAFVQTDPRGCSLYVLPASEPSPGSNYPRYTAVH